MILITVPFARVTGVPATNDAAGMVVVTVDTVVDDVVVDVEVDVEVDVVTVDTVEVVVDSHLAYVQLPIVT